MAVPGSMWSYRSLQLMEIRVLRHADERRRVEESLRFVTYKEDDGKPSGRKRLYFAGHVLYVRCSFQGRLHCGHSPVDESKKSTIRFFTVLILLEATMRFEEDYGHFLPLAFHAYVSIYIPVAKTRIPAALVTYERISGST